jgi:hypothetical protein
MKTYRLALEMIGAAISIEITDGHGAWALGKETVFSHRVNSPDADSDLTIDEKLGRRSACIPGHQYERHDGSVSQRQDVQENSCY